MANIDNKIIKFLNTTTAVYAVKKDSVDASTGAKIFDDAAVVFAVDASSNNKKGTLYVNGVDYSSVVKDLYVDASTGKLMLTVLDETDGSYKTAELDMISTSTAAKLADLSTAIDNAIDDLSTAIGDASSNALEFKLVEADTTSGALKSYKLQKKAAADELWVDADGVVIDIPKDYLLKSVSEVQYDSNNNTAYIDLVWNTKDSDEASTESSTRIDLSKLVDVYTVDNDSSAYLSIDGYKVSIDVDAVLGDAMTAINEVSARLANTDASVGEVSTRLNETSTRLDEVSTRLANTDASVAEVSTRLNETSTRLDEVSTRLAANDVMDASLAAAIGVVADSFGFDVSDADGIITSSTNVVDALKALAAQVVKNTNMLTWKVVG